MISTMMIVIFLLGMFLFTSSKLLSVLGILLSVVYLLLYSKKSPIKIPDKPLKIIKPLVLVAIFTVGAFTGITSSEGGINDYGDQLDHVMELMIDNDLVKARTALENIKETFGTSDNTILLETLIYLGESDFDTARNMINYYSDRYTVDYYTLLETIYLTAGAQDYANDLRNMYIEAASRYPYWTHIQQMAGVSYLDRSEFKKSEYHLLRAYEQEPSNYQTAYYLGVSCYEQQRMSEALVYFEEALERQADEETASYIAWYIEDISSGGETDE